MSPDGNDNLIGVWVGGVKAMAPARLSPATLEYLKIRTMKMLLGKDPLVDYVTVYGVSHMGITLRSFLMP